MNAREVRKAIVRWLTHSLHTVRTQVVREPQGDGPDPLDGEAGFDVLAEGPIARWAIRVLGEAADFDAAIGQMVARVRVADPRLRYALALPISRTLRGEPHDYRDAFARYARSRLWEALQIWLLAVQDDGRIVLQPPSDVGRFMALFGPDDGRTAERAVPGPDVAPELLQSPAGHKRPPAYLVDGNNFVHRAWGVREMNDRHSSQLVQVLGTFAQAFYYRGEVVPEVVVFFDAGAQFYRIASSRWVRVVVADFGEQADDRLAAQVNLLVVRDPQRTLWVVTDDAQLAGSSRRRGARVLGVRQFAADLERTVADSPQWLVERGIVKDDTFKVDKPPGKEAKAPPQPAPRPAPAAPQPAGQGRAQLLAQLQQGTGDERRAAARALSDWSDAETVEALGTRLQVDGNAKVAREIIAALEKIATPRALEALRTANRPDRAPGVQQSAHEAAVRLERRLQRQGERGGTGGKAT